MNEYLLLIAIILSVVLTVRYNPWYYRYGLTVYKQTIPVRTSGVALPSDKEMGEMINVSRINNLFRFNFKNLSPLEVAFRENKSFDPANPATYSRFSPIGVMHGYIRFSPEKRTVTIKGQMDLIFLAPFLILMRLWRHDLVERGQITIFAAVSVAVILGFYYFQAARFNKMCEVLESRLNFAPDNRRA